MTLNLGEALDEEDYPAVELKVTALIDSGQCTAVALAYWVEEKGEGARQVPCANNFLTWAEYECYRKYNPKLNKLSSDRKKPMTFFPLGTLSLCFVCQAYRFLKANMPFFAVAYSVSIALMLAGFVFRWPNSWFG